MPADDETFALLEKLEDFFGGPDLTTAISDFAAAHGAEFHPLPEQVDALIRATGRRVPNRKKPSWLGS